MASFSMHALKFTALGIQFQPDDVWLAPTASIGAVFTGRPGTPTLPRMVVATGTPIELAWDAHPKTGQVVASSSAAASTGDGTAAAAAGPAWTSCLAAIVAPSAYVVERRNDKADKHVHVYTGAASRFTDTKVQSGED